MDGRLYHRAIENGWLEDSTAFELLDGLIVRKDRAAAGEDPMTIGDRHRLAVDACQPYHLGGLGDVFITKLTPDGLGLDYSTFFGGAGYDVGVKVVLDDKGNVQIAGAFSSPGPATLARRPDRRRRSAFCPEPTHSRSRWTMAAAAPRQIR